MSTDIAVPANVLEALLTGEFMSDEQQRSAKAQLLIILCQRAPDVARHTVTAVRERTGEFPTWDLLDAMMPLPAGIDDVTTTFLTTWHQELDSSLRAGGFPMPGLEPSPRDKDPFEWSPRPRLTLVEQDDE